MTINLRACTKCGFLREEHHLQIAHATAGDDLPQTPYTQTLYVCMATGSFKPNPLLRSRDEQLAAEQHAAQQQFGDTDLSHEQMR